MNVGSEIRRKYRVFGQTVNLINLGDNVILYYQRRWTSVIAITCEALENRGDYGPGDNRETRFGIPLRILDS